MAHELPSSSPPNLPTWNSTALLLARSALFPASAMTMLGLACLCNSFTQFLARANVSWGNREENIKGTEEKSLPTQSPAEKFQKAESEWPGVCWERKSAQTQSGQRV